MRTGHLVSNASSFKMTSFNLFRLSVVLVLFCSLLRAEEWIEASSTRVPAVDQKAIAPNSCGVVAQINTYLFAGDPWHSKTSRLVESPQKAFKYLEAKFYRRFSRYAYLQPRWSRQKGIRPDDLQEGMNELHQKIRLPEVKLSALFIDSKTTHASLLKQTHQRMKTSLEAGFPPILYIARFAQVHGFSGGHLWTNLCSHYVMITAVPRSLKDHSDTFDFKYVDPWGGRSLKGTFRISQRRFYANDLLAKNRSFRRNPTLELVVPNTNIGVSLLKEGQASALVPAYLIYANENKETKR